jgi:diaminohydroxyphosphoribosylaminopyrimidine deaminase/5-amino-6-(5-phosphoribosylamino)uracil reductase
MPTQDDSIDIPPMRRALDLALLGRGNVEPNPMVGCVIVKDSAVIGEEYHQQFGGPHAEPNALAACKQSPSGATVYVTLEPCCHTGKKTPPCVPALIGAQVRRVVVGSLDPNPAVAGKGLAALREAGIAVREGVLAEESRQLNAPYFKLQNQHRPYVTLKWAQTADGKVAGPGGQRLYISNELSHAVLHGLRGRSDAVLVGIRTVLLDDPLLTARGPAPKRPLLRVVLDSNLRMPVSSQLLRTTALGPVAVFCSEQAYRNRPALVAALEAHHVQVKPLPADISGGLSLDQLLRELGKQNITHLLVEPGPSLAESFLKLDLADRVWIFRSPKTVNDDTAPAAQTIDFPTTAEIALENDRLTEYLNPRSAAFFSLTRSPDLELVKLSPQRIG